MAYINRAKRNNNTGFSQPPPSKRVKTLFAQDTSENEREPNGKNGEHPILGDHMPESDTTLVINEEYAKRFEHNRQREELHRLQEKYGEPSAPRSVNFASKDAGEAADSDDSTNSEDEDDDGVFASATVDAQIQETLEAIRRKDPRVYDKDATFFNGIDADNVESIKPKAKQSKAVYLSDYHRENLLNAAASDNQTNEPNPYVKQQEDLQAKIVQEIHKTALEEQQASEEVEEDDFLVATESITGAKTTIATNGDSLQELDIKSADKYPEEYLQKFMSTRAWVPTERSHFQPFDSDDDEEDRRAEDFEEAFNLRFEDPDKSNEKLTSHARDIVAKHSVRKETLNPRKKGRELERTKKDAARQVRREENARLRKLKVGELEKKVQKIREAAGFRGQEVGQEDWSAFLKDGWDDEKWESEMRKRFGDDYYLEEDVDEHRDSKEKKAKPKKPKWNEEIDINDIVPDFERAEEYTLTRTDSAYQPNNEGGVRLRDDDAVSPVRDDQRRQELQKREARRERRKIENLVDENLEADETLSNFGKKHIGQFRYRETSPTAFGLTTHDILMASDSQLNQYAGLKKMAAFRDPDKKRKDKKQLGKKARLRQWREETFGFEQRKVHQGEDSMEFKGGKNRRRRARKKADSQAV